MTYRQRREALKMTAREFGTEAGISSSTVWHVEAGSNVHLYTLNKYRAALKRLEAVGPVRTEYPKRGSRRTKGKTQGRRRRDFVEARKMLGLSQGDLAAEFKLDVHEVSKIEAGWAPVDPIYEEMIDGFLRENIKARGMEWPQIVPQAQEAAGDVRQPGPEPGDSLPGVPCKYEYQDALKQGVKPGALNRLAKAIFPKDELEPKWDLCRACAGRGIVYSSGYGVMSGQPYKCPVCEGRGTVREGFYK